MIILNNIDITNYIKKNGITENPNKIIKDTYEIVPGASVTLPMGFHNTFSINLLNVEESLKTALESLLEYDAVSCTFDDKIFNASVDSFNSSIDIDINDLRLYSINITISDISISNEEGI